MNIKLRCKACKWRDKAENLGEQKLDDIFAEDKETNKDGRIYNKVGADEPTRTVGDNETGSAVLHEERANNGERIANGERGQQTLDEVSIASSDKADALPEDTRGRVEPDKAPEAVEPMSGGMYLPEIIIIFVPILIMRAGSTLLRRCLL